MKKRIFAAIALTVAFMLVLSSCSPYMSEYGHSGKWSFGAGAEEIALPQNSDHPLYIAGYRNGTEIDGVLDIPKARAVWIDTGEKGILIIGIDCVGCSGGTVARIREALQDFCGEVGCVSVNVYATHTHAGVDTLGLWGPVAVDGKNPDYMDALVDAAVNSAKKAYYDRSEGELLYGNAHIGDILHDSREPIEYDPLMHQLRFVSDDQSQNGIRLLFCAAHAESLRSENKKLSADFPGAMADIIKQSCGDDVMFIPGAIGGLIMTKPLVEPFDPQENMLQTADKLAFAALSISQESAVLPELSFRKVDIELRLDNTFFFFGKFLGILDSRVSAGKSDTGYMLHSELGVITLGDIALALIPGEIFPELVSGNGTDAQTDPEPLQSIAQRYGFQRLLIVGLCNDELGYIVPPSVFLVNEELPYIEPVTDENGENHYEETNSTGPKTAGVIADAFEKALGG